MTTRSMIAVVALGVGGLALVTGCGSSGSGSTGTTTTTAGTTMTTPIPGSTDPPSTPVTDSTASEVTISSPVNTLPALIPGQPCSAGSDPDCISPENDGQYVYLIGGAACMASPIGGPMCTDLDGDGYAGYPDRG